MRQLGNKTAPGLAKKDRTAGQWKAYSSKSEGELGDDPHEKEESKEAPTPSRNPDSWPGSAPPAGPRRTGHSETTNTKLQPSSLRQTQADPSATQDWITVQLHRSSHTRARSGSSSHGEQRVCTAGPTGQGPVRPPQHWTPMPPQAAILRAALSQALSVRAANSELRVVHL